MTNHELLLFQFLIKFFQDSNLPFRLTLKTLEHLQYVTLKLQNITKHLNENGFNK